MADGPTTLDDFTPEQLKALQDIAQARVDDSLSRRDALKALGMVGGGAATGAIGASTLADTAKADASTTDSDGDVGRPGDPSDVFADGVEIHDGPNNPIGTLDENGLDIPAVSTGQIQRTYYTSDYGSDGAAIQSALDDADATTGWAKVVVDGIDSTPYLVDAAAPLTVGGRTKVIVAEDVKLSGGVGENIFQNKQFEDTTRADLDPIIFEGRGGVLDGNMQNQTSDTTRTLIFGRYQNAISLYKVSRFRIENINTKDCRHSGIVTGGFDGGIIRDCTVRGDYLGGIQSEIDHQNVRKNGPLLIDGCTVEGGGKRAKQSAGIYASGVDHHRITNCTVRNRDNLGISVFDSGDHVDMEHIHVSNCTVEDVAATTTASNAIKSGISVYSRGGQLTNIVVNDCTVDTLGATDNSQHGFASEVDLGGSIELTISDSHFNAQKHGVRLQKSSTDSEYTTVKIGSGTVTRGRDGYGVYAKSASNVEIGDITAKQCGFSGIAILDIGYAPENCQVKGATAKNNGQSGTNPYGIRLFGAVNSTIENTRCYDDQGTKTQNYGIYTDSGTSGTVAVLNDLRGNATAGHNLQGSGAITDPVNQDTTEDFNVT